MALLLRPYRQELGGAGGNYRVHGVARHALNRDMLQPCKEDPLPPPRLKQQILLLVGEVERFLENINVGGRLLHQELQGRVREDRPAIRAPQEIAYVLGNGRYPKEVFATPLCDGEEEGGRILALHHPPRLVNDQETLLELMAYRIPDVVRDDVHGNGLQLILHVAYREHDELLVNLDVGGLIQKAGPGAV